MGAESSGRQCGARRVFDWLFVCVCLASTLPLWLTEHPPIQDWPQHLAAIRVLRSYLDPAFGFEQYFILEPLRTQYLSVYCASAALAVLVGVPAAAKLVLAAGIVGLPFAVRSLARSLGRSGDIALLAVPFAYSAHTILGFINFFVALPLMLSALSMTARAAQSQQSSRQWGVAFVLLVCFYTHVVPFAFGVMGVLIVSLRRPWRSLAGRVLPLGVVGLGCLPWLFLTPAGQTVRALVMGSPGRGVEPVYESFDTAFEQLPRWLLDVWRAEWDTGLWRAWLALIAAWAISGLTTFWRQWGISADGRVCASHRPAANDGAEQVTPLPTHVLLPLPVIAAVAYFVAPASYDWIWPINARFALVAVLLALPLLPEPNGVWLNVLSVAGVLLAAVGVGYVAEGFLTFEREEARGLDDAIEHIPVRQRVAGLIFQSGSRVVDFAPFLHSVAYYQAARGGAVMFTFADFPQSLFRFREVSRPPRVMPRWEWLPHLVDVDRDLSWYDWVLTRGGPGRVAQSDQFELWYSARPWAVWKRRRPGEKRP